MPPWKKWAEKVGKTAGDAVAGRVAGAVVNALLADIIETQKEEIAAILNVTKTDREGRYNAALLHLEEAAQLYISKEDREDLIRKAQERLFDCIGRAAQEDTFLTSMACARYGDTYVMLQNAAGAKQWYTRAVTECETALATANSAFARREDRAGTGATAGLFVGLGLSIGAAFLFPPLGAASLIVQLIGGTAASVGGLTLTVTCAAAGNHVGESTVVVAYEPSIVAEFRDALSTLRERQPTLFASPT